MSYAWGSSKLYAVKALMVRDGTGRGTWFWVRPSGNPDYPFFIEDDNFIQLALKEDTKELSNIMREDHEIKGIEDVTYKTVAKAREAAIDTIMTHKDSIQLIKIVDLTPHKPTYPEHEVVWFLEPK